MQSTKNMTAEEAYDKRLNVLMNYHNLSGKYHNLSGTLIPYNKDDLINITNMMNDIVKVYKDTENIIPFDDNTVIMVNHLIESIELMRSYIYHPAFN